MKALGIDECNDVVLHCMSWDYCEFSVSFCLHMLESFPSNVWLWFFPPQEHLNVTDLLSSPKRLFAGLPGSHRRLLGMRHHDNHAFFSYASSPFFQEDLASSQASPEERLPRGERQTMVLVTDGLGDDACISLYVSAWAEGGLWQGEAATHENSDTNTSGKGLLRLVSSNDTLFESLGNLYQVMATTQGGWKPLSAEGRCVK